MVHIHRERVAAAGADDLSVVGPVQEGKACHRSRGDAGIGTDGIRTVTRGRAAADGGGGGVQKA